MSRRLLFWATILGYALVLVWAAGVLPDSVPVHFALSGDADRIVGRSRALLEMSLVGVFVAALLGGLAVTMRQVPARLINVPHKDYWLADGRESRLRGMLADDVYLLGAVTMLLLVVVEILVVAIADDPAPSLGLWGWALPGVYLVAVLGYLTHMVRSRYRPEPG